MQSPPPAAPRSSALAITVVTNISAAILALGILLFGLLGASMSSYSTVEAGQALFAPFASLAFCLILGFNAIAAAIVLRAARRHNRVGSDLRQWLIGMLVTLLPSLLCLGAITLWLTS